LSSAIAPALLVAATQRDALTAAGLPGDLSRLGFWHQGQLHRQKANQELVTSVTLRFPAMVV
jgi:hypothetical protein